MARSDIIMEKFIIGARICLVKVWCFVSRYNYLCTCSLFFCWGGDKPRNSCCPQIEVLCSHLMLS